MHTVSRTHLTRQGRKKRALAAARKSLAEEAQRREIADTGPKQITVVEFDKKTGVAHVAHIIAERINIARPICSALLGEDHSVSVRMGAGLGVMGIGVVIAKVFGHGPGLMGYIADLVGYGIHGLGATPFIEHIAHKVKEKGNTK